jgi:molybdopterin-guanine dinucleotide biosynthesis protein B
VPPLVCVVGYSGAGKTTLMVNLIASLTHRGLRVGTIKHDAHGFQMDRPGKDSFRHKTAGATTSIISSPHQLAMVTDVDHDHAPQDLLPMLGNMDIVLAEGFKRAALPKIEVFRAETGKGPACQGDPHLLAVVSDAPVDWGVRRFATMDADDLAAYLIAFFDLTVGKVVSFQKSSS